MTIYLREPKRFLSGRAFARKSVIARKLEAIMSEAIVARIDKTLSDG
jgi:hypothetical protein